MKRNRMSTRHGGFTLIEVLVVVAIIALLVSILLPSLARARDSARTVVCQTRMRELFRGHFFYGADNKGAFPHWSWWLYDGKGHKEAKIDYLPASVVYAKTGGVRSPNSSQWVQYGDIFKYLRNPETYLCPADDLTRYPDSLGSGPPGSDQGNKAIHSYVRLTDIHDFYHKANPDGGANFYSDGLKPCDFINPDRLKAGVLRSDPLGATESYPKVRTNFTVPTRVVLLFEEYQGARNDFSGGIVSDTLNDGHSGLAGDFSWNLLSGRHNKQGQLLYWDGHCELGNAHRWNTDLNYAISKTMGGGGN